MILIHFIKLLQLICNYFLNAFIRSGKHEPAISEENNNTLEISNSYKLETILSVQPSNSMLNLSKIPPNQPEKECCARFLNSLKVNTKSVCEETFKSIASWKKERQFRVTGSRCYALYTYTKKKTANWEQKSQKYFYPKAFKKIVAMKHGIKYEPSARIAYEDYTGVKVTKIGLVVSEINPWLGYSPDGVTLDENGKPNKLIEIKCHSLAERKLYQMLFNLFII